MDQLPEVNMATNAELGSLNEGHNDTAFGKAEAYSGLTGGGDAHQPKSRHYVNLSAFKMLESVNMDDIKNTSTQTMFNIVNDILDECIEANNGDIPKRVASILKFVILEIQQRVSNQLKNVKKQSNLYTSHEAIYQSKIRVLETLVMGTTEENQVIMNQLQQIKIEDAKIKEEKDLREQDLIKVREEKEHCKCVIVSLQEELKLAEKAYEENRYHLETEAEETKNKLLKKIFEVECLLTDSRNKVKELQDFSESKVSLWKRKETGYKHFINSQTGSLRDLRLVADSIKQEVSEIEQIYAEELHDFGENLKGLIDAAQNYNTVLQENRKLYNEVQDLKGNIRVYCRIRPFLPGQSKKLTAIQYMGENGELVVMNPLKPGKDSHRLFKFNKVFGPSATQEEVFRDTQPLIRSVLDGYNVCIFAYGQTGSGKTYTMTGPSMASVVEWGVNYRALDDLFKISQNRRSSIAYEVGVQMVEIYNEQVRDLLCIDSSQKRLGIWSTSQPNGLVVPDASMHPVKSTDDVLEMMHIGLMNRAVGATALNERSSRSHSILTVHVRGLDLETNTVLRGCLHLVDLAGSERVDRSEATGDRLREAQHINKSLSALGDVIFALAQKNPHVPYRNSKLTQVLQSSLGGQAKTLMFVQLNPDAESYSETVSTLKFAERVSGVELGAARSNKEGRDIRELMEQVSFLKDTVGKKDEEIARLRMCITNGNCENNGFGSLKLSSQRFSGAEHYSEKDVYDVDEGPGDIGLSFDLSAGKCHNGDTHHLGFGNADFEDKLSDTSDGVVSLGMEMHTPINTTARPSSDKTEKRNVPVELPRPPVKQSQAGFSRPSLTRSSMKAPGPKRSSLSSSSAVKLSNRRQ